MRRASSTCWPRMRSTTRRALNGVTRTNRAWAFTSIFSCTSSCSWSLNVPGLSAHPGGPLLRAVHPEGAGGGELAERMADHRLGDVDGHVLAAVVDRDGVPDHVRDDRGAARPRPDDPLVAPAVQLVDLRQQMVVDERPFLQRSCHRLSSPTLAAAADDELVGGLAAAGPALWLAPRRGGVAATGTLALAAPEGVVDRVHGDPAHRRALALPAQAAGLAPVDQLLLGVADLADGGAAGGLHLAGLTGSDPA